MQGKILEDTTDLTFDTNCLQKTREKLSINIHP